MSTNRTIPEMAQDAAIAAVRKAAAPVGAVPQDWAARMDALATAAEDNFLRAHKAEAALASQAARMGELRELAAKWRGQSDSPYTANMEAEIAREDCADELDAAIDKLRGEAG